VGIVRAAACIAVFVALSTGISVSLPVASAGAADNCAAGPGAAAPKGQHWYYRVDQANHRKCWYLHATVPLAGRAAADTRAANSESDPPVATLPPPSTATAQTTDTPNTTGEIAASPSAPRLTVLNVKPVTPPSLDGASAGEIAIPQQTAEPPTTTVPADTDSSSRPPSRTHHATVRAAPDAARDASAPARGDVAAAAQTQSAWLLFPLLALALAIAAGLIAFLRKVGRSSRAPLLSEHPDDAWRRYGALDQQAYATVMHQDDAPFLAPHEPYGTFDLDAPEWPDQQAPAEPYFPATRQRGRPWPSGYESLTQRDAERRPRILRHPRGGAIPSDTKR
jgi:hypothetical protein